MTDFSNNASKNWPFQVRPLSKALGAEVRGINLEEAVDPDIFSMIYQAFIRHQVLVFENVDLPPDLHVKLSRQFGTVQVHVLNQYQGIAGYSEIFVLSNLREDGQPNGIHPDEGTLYWHSDGSWNKPSGLATLLYSERVPSVGGETHFANLYGAYDRLEPALKNKLEGRNAIHNLNFSRNRHMERDALTEAQKVSVPPLSRPVFQVHPDTGRTCILLGDHAESIEGMDYQEGRALIDRLNILSTVDELVYRHRWKPRQLVLWDNRCTLHRATTFDTAKEVRLMRRCTTLESAAE